MPVEAVAAVESRWEHFPHEADVGVRGYGRTLAEAFEQTALAMTAAITDPDTIAPEREIRLSCAAPDHELLLTDWLNALIYEMATRHMLFSRYRVTIVDDQLQGQAWGEDIDPARHMPGVEVKGATFTCLRVTREPDGMWLAQCVIDV